MGKSVTDTEVQEFIANSDKLLSCYMNMHQGKRCVIIGNGPSLNKMDLSFLRNEITFGLNRIYLGFEKWNFMPTYYVSVNQLVIEQNIKELLRIPVPKFLSLASLPYIPEGDNVIALKTAGLPLGSVHPFSRNPQNGLWEGFTVTYVAMQLAYYMGFRDVVLIGVDHHFTASGKANQEVVSKGDDPDHFHPEYFGKGVRWHLPDLQNSEVAYRTAKIAFEADGRRIIDATLDGKLAIFSKADYREVFFKQNAFDQINNERRTKVDELVREAKTKAVYRDTNEAVNENLRIIELYPEAAEAHNNLSALYIKSGEMRKSLEHLIKALRINPASRESVINCLTLLAAAGETEKARLICSVYFKKDAYDEEIEQLFKESGDIRKKGTLNENKDITSPELEEYVEEILLLISIGNALITEDNDEASRLCLGLLKYPYSPDLLNYQAELQFQLGNIKRAKSLFLSLIDSWPIFATAYNNLGVISLEEGDVKKSLQYFAKALKTAPTRETILNCGKLLTYLRYMEDARQLYLTYLEKQPGDEEISRLLEEINVPAEKEAKNL